MRALIILTMALAALVLGCDDEDRVATSRDPVPPGNPVTGREIFRFDTFGDERFWTDTLRMHEVIQSAVDPLTALGSYAGAMGASQFMPSSYRRYAVDGGNDTSRQ